MALDLAIRNDMRGGKKLTVIRMIAMCLFAAIIGVLGGRIVTAANVYAELGWTAMWAEIGAWGPSTQPEQIRLNSNRFARS